MLFQTRKEVLMLSLGVEMSEFILGFSLSLGVHIFLEEVRHVPEFNFLVVGATDEDLFVWGDRERLNWEVTVVSNHTKETIWEDADGSETNKKRN